MKSLLNALYTLQTGNGTLTAAFTGGFHRDAVAFGETRPALKSQVLVAPRSNTYAFSGTNTGGFNVVTITFTGYAGTGTNNAGHDGLLAKMESFTGVMDNPTLTLASGTVVGVLRLGDPVPRLEPDEDEAGKDEWVADVTYEFSVQG